MLTVDRPAFPGGRSEPGIGSKLPSVVEVSEQTFRVEDRCKFRTDPLDAQQH